MSVIDLRSDTVTRPSAGMRAAIAAAPVGDDQYGEDPSINLLQERFAELTGKEEALFVASGTMANQVALRVLTRPGDEVIVGGEAHVLWHESGAAALSGVQISSVGAGLFTAADIEAAFKPAGHSIYQPTTLVIVENTHNRAGGRILPLPQFVEMARATHALGMRVYLDGARLFNVAAVTGDSMADLSASADMVSISLSKGLGCPVGSVIAGSRADIAAARRVRRQLGGALRQAGILAAAGLYALDHNVTRLGEDHVAARAFAHAAAAAPRCILDPAAVETNIVVFHTAAGAPSAVELVETARRHDVLLAAFGPRTIRAVAHLDVTTEECAQAGAIVADIISAKA